MKGNLRDSHVDKFWMWLRSWQCWDATTMPSKRGQWKCYPHRTRVPSRQSWWDLMWYKDSVVVHFWKIVHWRDTLLSLFFFLRLSLFLSPTSFFDYSLHREPFSLLFFFIYSFGSSRNQSIGDWFSFFSFFFIFCKIDQIVR